MQSDLVARLQWQVQHDRDYLVKLLAATVPADLLRDALAFQFNGEPPARWRK